MRVLTIGQLAEQAHVNRETVRYYERRRLLHEFGSFVTSLGGLYSCAPDMNTSAEDMDVIAEVCPYVFCKTEGAGGSGDTAPDTAIGVLHGIRAACRFALGSDDLTGRTIVVQGAGGVGGRLIELLRAAGADVTATDIDANRLEQLRIRGVNSHMHPAAGWFMREKIEGRTNPKENLCFRQH